MFDSLHVLLYHLGSDVGGHDQDGVLEVHRPAFVVGQTAVVQYLKQYVEHVRMGLLYLVQQDYRVGLAPYRLSELTALVISDVSRRSADQTGDTVPFLILAHVDTGHHVLVIEQGLGKGLGQLCLTYTGGTEEHERAYGPLLVLQSGTASAHSIGHSTYGLILTHHSLVQHVLHVQQFGLLALEHTGHRYAGPFGDYLGYVLRLHRLVDKRVRIGRLLRRQLVYLLLGRGYLAVPQLGHTAIVTAAFRLISLIPVLLDVRALLGDTGQQVLFHLPFAVQIFQLFLCLFYGCLDLLQFGRTALTLDGLTLDLQLADLTVELVNRVRHRIHLQTQFRRGLVYEVNGLVREETVRDVSVRQLHRCNDGVIVDMHLVVVLVFFLQSTQDGNRLRGSRLVHHYHLETTLQSLVLLKILAVLLDSRRTYGPKLSTGQGRLQDIGSVHRTG